MHPMTLSFAAFRRLSLLALLASAAVFTVACPGPAYPKCEKDEQCKKNKDGKDINEYCLFGQCQQCAKDSNCATGEKCNRGRCEATCTADDQCGTGKMCENSTCVTAQCTTEKQCSGGESCTDGRCVNSTSAIRCTESKDCPKDLLCEANKCVPGTTPVVEDPNPGKEKCDKKVRVGFGFNEFELSATVREQLDAYAKCMVKNASWKLTIEGHADERGTTDYNLSLGQKRADAVRDYLQRLGVKSDRSHTVSYGEEKPLDTASTEEAWEKNRRCELIAQ
jgi:peptidoglycan-associated lipoprotein